MNKIKKYGSFADSYDCIEEVSEEDYNDLTDGEYGHQKSEDQSLEGNQQPVILVGDIFQLINHNLHCFLTQFHHPTPTSQLKLPRWI